MVDGRYLYCILEGKEKYSLSTTGLFDKKPYTVSYKDVNAVVSAIPFKEIRPDIQNITWHQKVVEESRNHGTTLPVRFGILFKTEEGVKKLLTKSYNDFKAKLTRLREKDEYGLKIIVEQSNLKKFKLEDTKEVKKIKKDIAASGKGAAYFLKMKMDEAIKNETYKKIDTLCGEIHREIASFAKESCLLKADLKPIVLNAAYLVNKKEGELFYQKLENIKQRYGDFGLSFHPSGPWAPYSFC